MEFLNYHHLRYFWMVAKEGGIRKAAEILHVSQPGISAQIAALEKELGEKLFQRSGQRHLTLTDTGREVLNYADEIFSLGQDLVSAIKRRPTLRPLRLHLGVSDALPKLVTYRIIEPVFHLPQAVQVACWETNVSEMLVDLVAHRLDMVLADQPVSSAAPGKVFNHFLEESGIVFCADRRLAAKLRSGFPKSLDGAPALLPMSDSGLRRSLEKWFHDVGVHPRVVGELEDPALVRTLAWHGHGFMAVPALIAEESVTQLRLHTFGKTDDCRQQFYAITAERKRSHPAVQAILSRKERRSAQ